MLKTILLFVFVILSLAACVHTSTVSRSVPRKTNFSEVDHNKNGKISLNEFIYYVDKREKDYLGKSLDSNLKVCDKNSDGKITLDEIHYSTKNVPPIFGKVDTRNKKYVCFINKKQFSLFDKNGDNIITRYELSSNMVPNYFGVNCDLNKDGKLDKKEATSKSCGFPNDEFRKEDLNKDGFLTLKELKYLSRQNTFLSIDKNKDNNLDINEFRDASFFGDALWYSREKIFKN